MRVESWEQVALDPRRALSFVLGVSAGLSCVVILVGEELRLGSVSVLLGLMAGGAGAYLLLTAPRRIVGAAAFRQTLEAPSLAASSNIYLKATSSRSRAVLMLNAEEPRLKSFIADVRRRVLLGYDAPSAAREAGPQKRVFSESAATVVDSLVGADRTRVEEGADELDSMLGSSGLDEETRLPLVIAVAFFLPIMLMLFAAVGKETSPAAICALAVLEVVVLDITMAFSGGTVGWGRTR